MKKEIRNLIALCVLVYISSYIGRLSYTSSMVGIMEATGTPKDTAGLVTTFFYFTYGCGQFINAFFCRRYKPRPVIAGILAVSAAANAAALLLRDPALIKFVWMLNGAAQSALWCTLIEMLSHKVPPEHKRKAILAMSLTVAIGTISIYGISAVCTAFGHPFLTFLVAAVILIAVMLVWTVGTRNLGRMENYDSTEAESKVPQKAILIAAVGAILVTGLLAIGNGFLKDTLVTWVPSLLYDEFALPGSYAIVITLLLPLLSFCGAATTATIHRYIKDYNAMLALLFCGTSAALGGVLLSYRMHSMILTILFAGMNACLMAAVNNVITSVIPLERKTGAGLFAGIMDAFCYVGSTLSGILPGILLETRGYSTLLGLMPVLGIFFTAFAFVVFLCGQKKKS